MSNSWERSAETDTRTRAKRAKIEECAILGEGESRQRKLEGYIRASSVYREPAPLSIIGPGLECPHKSDSCGHSLWSHDLPRTVKFKRNNIDPAPSSWTNDIGPFRDRALWSGLVINCGTEKKITYHCDDNIIWTSAHDPRLC
jgi:hypothetical protein